MEMSVLDILLKIGIIIFAGIIGGKVANSFKLPNVSGYIVGGLLIGPSLFNIITAVDADQLNIINDIALGAIAFSIGNEFLLKEIKKVGKNIFIITLAQVTGTMILVFVAMYVLFKQPFTFSLVISSMAAATAPAGVLLVIRELKAKGPLVDTILPVVAIDDALGLMAFGISLSIAKMMMGSTEISFIKMVAAPLIEIVGSLGLGFILGLLLSMVAPKTKNRDELLSVVVGFIILGSSLSSILNLSPLLTNMMVGSVVVNVVQKSKRIFDLIADVTPPIYLMFFTLAGAGLDIKALSSVGLIGIFYIISRTIGKVVGAGLGAKVVGSNPNVVKYLGMSLLPLGGISIGLSIIVSNDLPQFGESIVTIVLFSVLIFEIFGPIFTKIGIVKSGEENGALKK
jgi:Kef-type K+ transport system membrane component KefB